MNARLGSTALRLHARGKGLGTLAMLGLWVLFPLFFVYHVAIARGVVPDVARGLWGTASVAVALVALGAAPAGWRLQQIARSRLAVLCAVLILFAGLWTALNAALLNVVYLRPAVEQMAATWVAWIALCFVGAWFPWRRPATVPLLVGGLACMVLVLLVSLDTSRLVLDMRSQATSGADVASYQGFARSVLVTGTLTICLMATRTSALAAGAVTAVALFAVGARSEFFGFVLVMGLYAAVRFGRDTLGGRAYTLLVLVGVALVAFLAFDGSRLMASRQLEVLDLSEASSWIARNELLRNALDQLAASPLIGDFGGHFVFGNNGGLYAHNALSAWVELGLPGFLLYVGAIVYAAWVSTRRFVADPHNGGIWGAAMCISLLSLLLVVVSKPVFWPVPALAWGLVFNALLSDAAQPAGVRAPPARPRGAVGARRRGPHRSGRRPRPARAPEVGGYGPSA